MATVTTPEIKMVLIAALLPDLTQLARHSAERVRRLAEDLAVNGLLQPIGVLKGGRILWGHGRYAAAKLNGWEKIEAKVFPDTLPETQIQVISLLENIQHEPLTDQQVYLAVQELRKLNPAWQKQELAKHLHRSPSAITHVLSVDELIPAAREQFLGGAFGFSVAYELSKADPQRQHELLSARLNGQSRDALRREARRGRNGNGQAPAVRVNRIKIEVDDITVTFSGKNLSLDDAIEAAPEAAKLMKKGRDEGLTARTISKASAERAKAKS